MLVVDRRRLGDAMQPQRSFADVADDGTTHRTRREMVPLQMDALIPWRRLERRIRPFYPTGERGRPPYPLAMMRRIYGVQLLYNLSDPAMEDALDDSVAVQRFVGVSVRGLRAGTIVDATIIDALAWTTNRSQARDPDMHRVQKGTQWSVGMKAPIGVDAGYQGVARRPEHRGRPPAPRRRGAYAHGQPRLGKIHLGLPIPCRR